jgi:oligopeptide/dipeptide ABC transporter ATP-binding protein
VIPEARSPGDVPALAVDRLRIELRSRGASTALLHDVGFVLRRRERLALVGESGSGKTITALALMRLLRAPLVLAGGSIVLGGETELATMSDRDLAEIRGSRVAMIYQDPLTALNPVLRIGDQLVEAIMLHSPLSKRVARARAIELLGQVGLSHPASRIDAYPHEFSGGMRQRVMIAMALSGDPEVLIADEPTTALDVTTQARILALLDELVSERGISVLLITHDLGIAAGFCDRVHVMYAGRIVERSDVFSIYSNPLHPYSEALLAAVCRLDVDISREIPAIPGYPPAPTALPPGCVFNPRCPYREPICVANKPDDVTVGERMAACHFAAARQRGESPPLREVTDGLQR